MDCPGIIASCKQEQLCVMKTEYSKRHRVVSLLNGERA